MPTLRDILEKEAGGVSLGSDFDQTLLDHQVIGMRLTTGAPCSSHSELFAPWPGPEDGIKRWFQLAGGTAVGVVETGDENRVVAVADPS